MKRLAYRLGGCLLVLCWLLLACDGDFPPGSRVDSLRILALAADRPFARPGEEVALDLLAVGPGLDEASWAWGTCTLPEDSSATGCLEALDSGLEPFDPEQDELSVLIPPELLDDLPESQRPSALVGVAIVACPGELESGATESLPIACIDEEGARRSIDDIEVAVKRIFVRERDRNANPDIDSLRWDREPWPDERVPRARRCEVSGYDIEDCPSSLQHRIVVEAGDTERGRDELGAAFEEQLIVQFYATHGLFRDEVRIVEAPDNRWAPRGADDFEAGDLATLWFILRDNRGGATWATRQVELR